MKNTYIPLNWPRSIHETLAFKTKPYREQRRDIWHEAQHRYNQHYHRHTSMHIHKGYTRSNTEQWPSTTTKDYIISSWPSNRNEIPQDSHHPYWIFWDDLTVIDGLVRKGKRLVISAELQKKILDKLYSNDIGIDKTRLLPRESICWVNMNVDIKKYYKTFLNMPLVSADTAKGEDHPHK